eukprot:CAMPEP_0115494100 /NCGR_PEP_ID=MMETSP0271-20121206/64542_1 /TAXON_ID=71861 /ORGANISM="Scrippsiella trochoidea, Strain CCMP3099" /LENGTH=102 /DNA_ID=CAMNT_0002922661 /DNA_START=111 /DNA_END=419 /DNA_ORIENTATION=+
MPANRFPGFVLIPLPTNASKTDSPSKANIAPHTLMGCWSSTAVSSAPLGMQPFAHSNAVRHAVCTAHSLAATPQCRAAQVVLGGNSGQCSLRHCVTAKNLEA